MSASSNNGLSTNSFETFDNICFSGSMQTTHFYKNDCISKIMMGLMNEGINKMFLMNENSRKEFLLNSFALNVYITIQWEKI